MVCYAVKILYFPLGHVINTDRFVFQVHFMSWWLLRKCFIHQVSVSGH